MHPPIRKVAVSNADTPAVDRQASLSLSSNLLSLGSMPDSHKRHIYIYMCVCICISRIARSTLYFRLYPLSTASDYSRGRFEGRAEGEPYRYLYINVNEWSCVCVCVCVCVGRVFTPNYLFRGVLDEVLSAFVILRDLYSDIRICGSICRCASHIRS